MCLDSDMLNILKFNISGQHMSTIKECFTHYEEIFEKSKIGYVEYPISGGKNIYTKVHAHAKRQISFTIIEGF